MCRVRIHAQPTGGCKPAAHSERLAATFFAEADCLSGVTVGGGDAAAGAGDAAAVAGAGAGAG